MNVKTGAVHAAGGPSLGRLGVFAARKRLGGGLGPVLVRWIVKERMMC